MVSDSVFAFHQVTALMKKFSQNISGTHLLPTCINWECGNILDRLHGIAQASPSPRYRVVHLAPAFVERLEPAVHVPFDVGVEPRPELVEPHLRPVAAVVELLLQRPEEAFGAGVVGAA